MPWEHRIRKIFFLFFLIAVIVFHLYIFRNAYEYSIQIRMYKNTEFPCKIIKIVLVLIFSFVRRCNFLLLRVSVRAYITQVWLIRTYMLSLSPSQFMVLGKSANVKLLDSSSVKWEKEGWQLLILSSITWLFIMDYNCLVTCLFLPWDYASWGRANIFLFWKQRFSALAAHKNCPSLVI